MNGQPEAPLHIAPNEVRMAVEDYVQQHYPRTFGKILKVTFVLSEYGAEFTGATVEITQ